ncbi:MAG: transposase [Candidatus Poribacteria bacterium]|nr:transposase [Candidatus Poribacteria bacterium]MYK19962.1 transposase [Candidatus Poribacteria bacterium]
MSEIVSLFTVFSPYLSAPTPRQFCEIVFAVLAMTGGVTLRNISRWTKEGGSYRTIQRFYNTLIPWSRLFWVFFRAHLYDPDDVYLLAGDETVVPKSGDATYGLSRFFSSIIGKVIPGLVFFAVSIISIKQRRSYPMCMEQIVRGEASTTPKTIQTSRKERTVSKTSETQGKPGRPKGSKDRNKSEIVLNDTLKQSQSMLKTVLATIRGFIPIR